MFDRLPIVRPSLSLLAVDIIFVTILCTLAAVWVGFVHARTHNRVTTIVHACFAAYVVALLCVVLLPLHGVRAAAESYQGTHPLSRAWYWGFRVQSPYSHGQWHWQRIANVAMTIPFGFGFGLLAPRLGVRRIFAACIAWAVSLEFAQLSISVVLGFVYRTFDINDIIDNALGASIGLAGFVTTAIAVRTSGFGADRRPTALSGFVAESVDRYFAAHEARRGRRRSIDSERPGAPDRR